MNNQIRKIFNLPEAVSSDWLKKFFSLETSLGIDIKLLKEAEFPEWIYADSSFVSVRYLDFQHIQNMVSQVGAPVITTSLNLSGEAPIVELSDATEFQQI